MTKEKSPASLLDTISNTKSTILKEYMNSVTLSFNGGITKKRDAKSIQKAEDALGEQHDLKNFDQNNFTGKCSPVKDCYKKDLQRSKEGSK